MSQQADIQPYSIENILQILRNQALAMPLSSTSTRYIRALDSLQSSALHSPLADTPKDTAATAADTEPLAPILRMHLTDWLISQWMMRNPFSTASLYLDIISSLYGSAVKAGLLPPSKLFSQLKVSLKAIGPQGWKSGIDDEIFERALRLTKNISHLLADDATAAAMVVWSLTHSLQPLADVALLKREDLESNANPQSENDESFAPLRATIISLLCANTRRNYIFDLRQSQRTPKQLQAHISKIVNDLFRRARLPQATDPYQTVEALWAYAALRIGIPASTLISHLGHVPLGLPVLKLSVVRCPLSEQNTAPPASILRAQRADTVKEYFSQVGKIFLDNPPQWYAMSLRPGVRFTQVCRRLELLGDRVPQPQLFYPCEEIARAIGKKIVTRQRPVIHSVVFFRAKLTDIGRLFARIGDLAWCYRQSARPGAPYAHISDAQFRLFQQTIAQFTPDYEVASAGELKLTEGDRIRILGGLFSGQEATIKELRVKSQESSNTAANATDTARSANTSAPPSVVYRLNIIGDNGIEWRITADPRLLME